MQLLTFARTLAFVSSLLFSIPAAGAFASTNVSFPLVVSPGAAYCLPYARAHATISSLGSVENLHVEIAGLPRQTDFAFFVIQVPNFPFGLSSYQGDIVTDDHGYGVGDFTGRYSIGTFIVAPGVAPAPLVLTKKPFPDASSNPATAPVQLYHLGLWFNSPYQAGKAGCATTVTPFNSEHHAGIQVFNTGNYPATSGPLLQVH